MAPKGQALAIGGPLQRDSKAGLPMPSDLAPRGARGNQLLALLPEADYRRLLPLLKAVRLRFKQVLYESRGPIDYAYFPTGAVCSALTLMQDGSAIEVATVGREGLIGHSVVGGGKTSPNKVIVQIGDGG